MLVAEPSWCQVLAPEAAGAVMISQQLEAHARSLRCTTVSTLKVRKPVLLHVRDSVPLSRTGTGRFKNTTAQLSRAGGLRRPRSASLL